MDLAALFPKWITIRKGSFIIAVVGICINPWRILNVSHLRESRPMYILRDFGQTANSFISAMSAYGVFLGPLTGIMVVGPLNFGDPLRVADPLITG